MCNHLGLARDTACGDPPSSPAGDESPLRPRVRWTGCDGLPCLDAPVKIPLVVGGRSDSVDCPESGFLGCSLGTTLGTPGLPLSYFRTMSFSVWTSPFPRHGKSSPANMCTSGCHRQACELLANCRFFMSRHGKIRLVPTTQGHRRLR